jgi:hypothetical protein
MENEGDIYNLGGVVPLHFVLEKPVSLVWQIGWSSFCNFCFLLDFLLSWSLDAF